MKQIDFVHVEEIEWKMCFKNLNRASREVMGDVIYDANDVIPPKVNQIEQIR